jgi:hypothetical protein
MHDLQEFEFLNDIFLFFLLGNVKNSSGNITPATVHRAGKIAGPVCENLNSILYNNSDIQKEASYTKRKDYSADVQTFLNEYSVENLFKIIPGREHSSFPKFELPNTIAGPEKLKKKLLEYSKKLDRKRKKCN